MSVPGTVLTSSTTQKVRFVAAAGLDKTMLKVDPLVYNFELSELLFDGNKNNRTQGSALCSGYRGAASNILVLGDDFVIHHVETINALCGSALEVNGEHFEIWRCPSSC